MYTHRLVLAQSDTTYVQDSVIDPPNVRLTAYIYAGMAISEFLPMPWDKDDYDHTRRDLYQLHTQQLPAVDRIVFPLSEQRMAVAKPVSDILAGGSFAFPLWAGIVVSQSNDDLINLGIVYFCGYLTGAVGVDHLKSIFDRARPYNYTKIYVTENRFLPEGWSSMPSGHTFTSAYNCFFAASIADRYYLSNDKTNMRIMLWSAAATYPLVTGYFRMAAGRHFTTDVLAGYGIGAGLGLLFPYLLEDKHQQDISWMPIMQPNLFGMGMHYQF